MDIIGVDIGHERGLQKEKKRVECEDVLIDTYSHCATVIQSRQATLRGEVTL